MVNTQKIVNNILGKKYKLHQKIDTGLGIDLDIKFDKKGRVIGEYYGKCPICGDNENLQYNKNGVWCCRWCYYGRKKK